MLKKWKCRRCGKAVTKYSTICDSFDCTEVRGFWGWLLNWDNPCIGLVVLSCLIYVAVLVAVLLQ